MRRPWSMARSACWIAGCLVVSSSCTLDEVGLVGATHDAGSRSDAPVPVLDASLRDAPAPEASTDAATRDGNPPPDAPNDAPPEAPSGPWCTTLSPAPLFCDDFDFDSPALVPPWGAVNTAGGAIEITSALYTSPPSSVSYLIGATSTCQKTTLRKSFAKAYKTLDFSFDLYPDAGSGEVAGIGLGGGYEVDLVIGQSSGQTYLLQHDGINPTTHAVFDAYPSPGKWVRLGVHVELPPAATLMVTVDGSAVYTTPIDKGKKPQAHGPPTVYLGPTCYNVSALRQLYYDNVAFDAF